MLIIFACKFANFILHALNMKGESRNLREFLCFPFFLIFFVHNTFKYVRIYDNNDIIVSEFYALSRNIVTNHTHPVPTQPHQKLKLPIRILPRRFRKINKSSHRHEIFRSIMSKPQPKRKKFPKFNKNIFHF